MTNMTKMPDNWIKKSKGNAKIYTHPNLKHSICENHYGITYAGMRFESVDIAKEFAIAVYLNGVRNDKDA